MELAETIAEVAEGASGLRVRVGLADGKFAAYVAAVLGDERGRSRAESNVATQGEGVVPQAVLPGAKDLYFNLGSDASGEPHRTKAGTSSPASGETHSSFPSPTVRGRYGRGMPDPGGSALPEVER